MTFFCAQSFLYQRSDSCHSKQACIKLFCVSWKCWLAHQYVNQPTNPLTHSLTMTIGWQVVRSTHLIIRWRLWVQETGSFRSYKSLFKCETYQPYLWYYPRLFAFVVVVEPRLKIFREMKTFRWSLHFQDCSWTYPLDAGSATITLILHLLLSEEKHWSSSYDHFCKSERRRLPLAVDVHL